MKKLIWIIPVIIVFLSCNGQSKRKAAEENKLSVLIFHDSVVAYNGIFYKNITYKKYFRTEFEKLNEIIEQHRHKYGTQSEILLKIALWDLDGYAELVENALEIEKQNSGPDFKMAEVTETEQQFFGIGPFKWSIIDSLRKPTVFDMNMPKDIEVNYAVDENTFTSIIFNNDSIYCYLGNNLSNGIFHSINNKNTYRTYLQLLQKKSGKKLSIVLKPTLICSYQTTVDVLDEMTINNVGKYVMTVLSQSEKEFLNAKDFNWTPPEPITFAIPESATSQKLPDNNAFLIEIKKDQSVWYQILLAGTDATSRKLKDPITKTLKIVVADFEKENPKGTKKYLIKGDAEARYPVFEKVIEALKQNNIYKYNLITETTQ